MLFPPRSTGEGARPATFAASGGGRAGTGSRGILERSGAELAGFTRPPSAWLEVKGRVWLQARPLRSLGLSETGGPGPGKA
ncbi:MULTISPECIES: hypothetical protein [unclassified Caulobacter]|uniref:hypothetical protein n=1 Tax=Caulobacter sp. 3R27C2-B TaxID=2502219 RepID=UPI001E3099FC|nr:MULTISPECIES: hypothetical protein [unclassified Caulobacter]